MKRKKHLLLNSAALIVMVVLLNSFTMKPKTYIYIDGNNNTYTITPKSIDYSPIEPKNSSSGTYSGGEPRKKNITPEEYKKIEGLIDAIKKAKTEHEKTRLMGCGTLSVSGSKKVVYISMKSQHKANLESELQSILFGR